MSFERQRLKLEIQGVPGCNHMAMMVNDKIKTITDLVAKIRTLIPEIGNSEVKIYQDKFLLPLNEEIIVINPEEMILVHVTSSSERDVICVKTEYNEEVDEFKNKTSVDEMNMKILEESLKHKEENLLVKEEALNNLETSLRSKEISLEIDEEKIKRLSEDLQVKEELLNRRDKDSKQEKENLEDQRQKLLALTQTLEMKEQECSNKDRVLKTMEEDMQRKVKEIGEKCNKKMIIVARNPGGKLCAYGLPPGHKVMMSEGKYKIVKENQQVGVDVTSPSPQTSAKGYYTSPQKFNNNNPSDSSPEMSGTPLSKRLCTGFKK